MGAKDELVEGARRGVLAAATTDRDRSRLTEIARTMMHSGITVRPTGDHLEIPTPRVLAGLRHNVAYPGDPGTVRLEMLS